jgi:hypothetical protein
MKSKEQIIRELLAEDSEAIKVALPQPFYLRLVAAGRRKFGTLPKSVVVEKALIYAAANGLVDWERELDSKVRRSMSGASALPRSKTKAVKKPA